MNKALVGGLILVGAGILSFGIACTEDDDARNNVWDLCEKKAEDKHRNEICATKDQRDALEKKSALLNRREENEINNRISAWEASYGYQSAVDALEDEMAIRKNELKRTYDYDNEVDRMKKKRDDIIEDWKITQDYDGRMEGFDGRRSQVKEDYRRQEAALNLSNFHGANDNLLKQAKTDRDNRLNQIGQEKQKLESEFKTCKNNAEAQYKRELRDLKDKMAKAEREIETDVNGRVQIYRSARTDELASIIRDVKGERTESENNFTRDITRLDKELERLENIVAVETANEYDKLNPVTMKVMYYKDIGLSKSQYIRNSCLPLIPVGVGVVLYLMHVADIAGKMED